MRIALILGRAGIGEGEWKVITQPSHDVLAARTKFKDIIRSDGKVEKDQMGEVVLMGTGGLHKVKRFKVEDATAKPAKHKKEKA